MFPIHPILVENRTIQESCSADDSDSGEIKHEIRQKLGKVKNQY